MGKENFGYNLLRSRKFPIPEESVIGVAATIASYILGVALEDGLRAK